MQGIATLAQQIRVQERMRVTRKDLNRLSLEVASGSHADYFKGLGSQAGRGMGMRETLSRANFFKEAGAYARVQLDTQQAAIGQIKATAEEVRSLLLSFRSSAENITPQTISEGAMDFVRQARGAINQSIGGRFVFSGPATATPPLRERDAAGPSGQSPAEIIETIKSRHNLTTESGMRVFLDDMRSVFDGSHADPDLRFEPGFYAGATEGSMAALVDYGVEVSLDVRANDPAFREVMESLEIFASISATETTADSYRVMAEVLSERLSVGISRITDLSGAVGYREQLVADTTARHDQTITLMNNTISELESIDGDAAATRLTLLETQMQLTYTLTARLNNLTLANYL